MLLFGLLLSNVASAVTVQINNGFDEIYDPIQAQTDGYQANVVVSDSQNFSFRFGFIEDNHEFVLTINLPNDFPGTLYWGRSSELNGSGQAYGGGYLVAGESVSLLIGGVPGSSSENIHYEALNLVTDGVPDPIGIPVNNVPVPPAVWLFGSGLLGLVGMARRKQV